MDNELIAIGDEVKATKMDNGDVKLGGYLIRFADASAPDLSGDFFTKSTDFGDADKSAGWFNHRMPVEFEGKRIRHKGELPVVELTRDNVGIFAEIVIGARNEYEKMISDLGVKGKLSWSSGTAPHLVDRKTVGNVSEVTRWKLGLDASLTPTPAEPRNSNNLVSIKSISEPMETEMSETKADYKVEGMLSMEAVEAVAAEAVTKALAQRDAAEKAAAEKADAIKAAKDEGYQDAIKEIKAKGVPHFNRITEAGFSEEKDAVPAFKHWVSTGQPNQALITPDASYSAIKAAFNVTTGGTGGYLVPDPLYAQIVAKRDLASWVRQAPTQKFTTPADHLLVPVEDTAHTDFVLTAEREAYDENEATVAQVDMILSKYTKVIKATEEFLSDNGTNFDAWLMEALGRAEAGTENTVATAALYASAQASGITTAAAAAITVPELASLVGSLNGGYNVSGQTGFIMKNATEWYLKGVFGTNYYAFDGLFNQPVFRSDDMEAVAATKKAVLYGNFNLFGVIEKPGMMVQRNPYLYMANGQVGIFASIFRGYNVLQAEAFKTLLQHA